jgi:sigma54-dependent transcription regulator
MSDQHTKEPWSINEWPQQDTSIGIGAVGTPIIARVALRDVSINEQRANAHRIIACVNACAGIPTVALVAEKYIQTASYRMRQSAEQQRDELLAALETLRPRVIDEYDRLFISGAIAKVKP